jgi:tetratricopeptide (TPR) repeat protein
MKVIHAVLSTVFGAFIFAFFLPTAGAQSVEDKCEKANILLDEDRFVEALSLYDEVLKTDYYLQDKKKSRILNNTGFCLYKLNDLEKAVDSYKKALEIDPNYANCLNNLAVVMINQKKYKEAVPCLEQANRIEKNIKIVFNLFAVYYYLDHRKEALVYLEEAFRLDEAYTEDRLKKKNISQRDIDRLKKYIKA